MIENAGKCDPLLRLVYLFVLSSRRLYLLFLVSNYLKVTRRRLTEQTCSNDQDSWELARNALCMCWFVTGQLIWDLLTFVFKRHLHTDGDSLALGYCYQWTPG